MDQGFYVGEEIDVALDGLGAGDVEVDPADVEAVEHLDVGRGAVGGEAVLGHRVDPGFAGDGEGGDGLAEGLGEGFGDLVGGVVGGAGELEEAVAVPGLEEGFGGDATDVIGGDEGVGMIEGLVEGEILAGLRGRRGWRGGCSP